MATSKTTQGKPPRDPNVLQVEAKPGQSTAQRLAALVTDGTLTAATLQTYANAGPELGITELVSACARPGE